MRISTPAYRRLRVQNTTSPTTIPGATILQKILLSNADAAVQTLTITDGSVVNVLRMGAGASGLFDLGTQVESGTLTVTPSNIAVDALVLFTT